MGGQTKIFLHFSTLITKARLKLGFATLRELYREKKPSIDYNTWLHAESGRRVPSSAVVQSIAEILQLEKQAVLIAYCKDKFDNLEYHKTIASFEHNRFTDVDALFEARNHERSNEYVFNEEQIRAFEEDIRIRQFMVFTYDRERKTTYNQLATFFAMKISEVEDIVSRLESLGLVEVMGETIKKVYPHTTFPRGPSFFELRKKLLLKNLERTVQPNSHIVNYYVNLSKDSYKKVLAFFDFIEANLTKMDLDDSEKVNSHRYQITITGNQLSEACEYDRK